MTTLNKTEIIDYLVDNNFCVTDKVCVFCSTITDGWNAVCYSCNEYKGMMNLVSAVEHYGTDVLGF
jgi:hypothetical protein